MSTSDQLFAVLAETDIAGRIYEGMPCIVCKTPVAEGTGAQAMPPALPAMHSACVHVAIQKIREAESQVPRFRLEAHRVVIDETDVCNSCGLDGRGRMAVSFGPGKPVICDVCIQAARIALGDFRPVVVDGKELP